MMMIVHLVALNQKGIIDCTQKRQYLLYANITTCMLNELLLRMGKGGEGGGGDMGADRDHAQTGIPIMSKTLFA